MESSNYSGFILSVSVHVLTTSTFCLDVYCCQLHLELPMHGFQVMLMSFYVPCYSIFQHPTTEFLAMTLDLQFNNCYYTFQLSTEYIYFFSKSGLVRPDDTFVVLQFFLAGVHRHYFIFKSFLAAFIIYFNCATIICNVESMCHSISDTSCHRHQLICNVPSFIYGFISISMLLHIITLLIPDLRIYK